MSTEKQMPEECGQIAFLLQGRNFIQGLPQSPSFMPCQNRLHAQVPQYLALKLLAGSLRGFSLRTPDTINCLIDFN